MSRPDDRDRAPSTGAASHHAQDVRLVAEALGGDAGAGAWLDQRLARLPVLVRSCHARMGSPLAADDLEDAIQEAALTAWKRRAGFRGESSLDTWLYGIARLSILQQIGARRRTSSRERSIQPKLADERQITAPGPATQADTGIHRAIQSSLSDQGSTVQAIVQRRSVEGESFVQIGEELHMAPSTVKTRYYRSLPKLRSVLDKLWRDVSA